MKLQRFFVLLLILSLAPAAAAEDLDRLASWMTGSFSSAAQAQADTDYFDIRLEMVPIWTERDDGPWLYVEQATAATVEQPYRQRVYHLVDEGNGAFSSEVYEIPDPLRFAGAWREPEPLAGLSPDDLLPREGCAVVLRWQDNVFAGSTLGKNCVSTLRGAAYATSEVVVEKGRIVSWDRGFDDADRQVWGAEKGGYVFVKSTD